MKIVPAVLLVAFTTAFQTRPDTAIRLHQSISLLKNSASNDSDPDSTINSNYGELERLKQEEQRLSELLTSVRQQKLAVLRSRPLTIGVMGFGRFGQFIAKSFTKYGNVVGTSRSDYKALADEMGIKYIPMSDMERFVVNEDLDVIVLAVSIVSFENTVKELVPHLKTRMEKKGVNSCPLIVDVLSVKEHPRNIFLELVPEECDLLLTHPMFGPDSAKNGWDGQTFVYEKTRINKVLLYPDGNEIGSSDDDHTDSLMDDDGHSHKVHSNSESFIEGVDRMERFLSIWEEEGCNMTPLSCANHDAYAANSQFITHLMGRILGAQGLQPTPIDTRGFQSVLKLIENTNADSFDLFYGLYKYNRNSDLTIEKLRASMDDVTRTLLRTELKEARDR
jgi:arogenate dehydrogenase (NADP+)